MRFIVVRDPTRPGGSSEATLTDAILREQTDLTNDHFRESPFRFKLTETVYRDNQEFATADTEADKTAAAESVQRTAPAELPR